MAAPTIADIIEKYNSKPTGRELELRFTLDQDAFTAAYRAKIEKTAIISKQVAEIYELRGTFKNLVITTIRDEKGRHTFKMIKESIARGNVSSGVKLALSAETDTKMMPVGRPKIIRFKHRASATIGEWRYDLTKSYEAYDSVAIAKTRLTQLIAAPMGPERFVEISSDDPPRFELECEHIGVESVSVAEIETIAATVAQAAGADNRAASAFIAEMREISREICGHENARTLKRALPQVYVLTKNMFAGADGTEPIDPIGMYISLKADGLRAVGILRGAQLTVVSSAVSTFGGVRDDKITEMVDGEFCAGKLLYVFDVMIHEGRDITGNTYAERQSIIGPVCVVINAKCGVEMACPKTVIAIADRQTLRGALGSLKTEAKGKFESDGYILTQANKSYTATVAYKVKPASQNTIDFLAIRAVDRKSYNLCVSASTDEIAALRLREARGKGRKRAVLFTPLGAPEAYIYTGRADIPDIDGKIVEMSIISDDGRRVEWKFHGIRDDRAVDLAAGTYFGNAWLTAESAWINYINPLSLDELWQGVQTDYFAEAKHTEHIAMTRYVSAVKEAQIAELSGTVVDLGFGRGADMWRYSRAKIDRLIGVDRDTGALASAMKRRYPGVREQKGLNMKLDLIVLDLHTEMDKLIPRLKAIGARTVNHVVINNAIHYLIPTMGDLRVFAATMSALIAPAGTLNIVCMDGARVAAAMSDRKQLDMGTPLRYSIKRMYAATTLRGLGQKIGVLLPFSNGKYYEEYLVNFDEISRELAAFKMSHITPVLSVKNIDDTKLDEIDKTFLNLYVIAKFTRKDTK